VASWSEARRVHFRSVWRSYSKYPTDEGVLVRLRELHAQGIPMAYKAVMSADTALWGTINRRFPSLKDAIEAAGLEYINVPKGRTHAGIGCKPRAEIRTPERCPDYAYFIGVLLGDGSISRSAIGSRNTAKCDGFDIEMCQNFAEKGERMFGIKPKWLKTERTGPHRAVHGDTFYRVAFYSNTMANYLVQETQDKKKIPEWIRTGSNDIKAGFIRGFADAEGCAARTRNGHRVSIAQKDRTILEDIRVMLQSFGIVSTIHKGGRECHNLSLNSIPDNIIFRDNIGFSIMRKQSRLDTITMNRWSAAQLKRYRGV